MLVISATPSTENLSSTKHGQSHGSKGLEPSEDQPGRTDPSSYRPSVGPDALTNMSSIHKSLESHCESNCHLQLHKPVFEQL